MTATIPLIIPAAAKGPRKGWKILETKDTKRSKRFPFGASPPHQDQDFHLLEDHQPGEPA